MGDTKQVYIICAFIEQFSCSKTIFKGRKICNGDQIIRIKYTTWWECMENCRW